jgi:rod shape determining protein RodA
MQKIMQAIRDFFRKGDLLLLMLCVGATIFGIVVISSATNYYGSTRYVLIQSFALLLGVLFYFLFTLIDVDIFAERRDLLFIFNLLLKLLIIPFGIAGTTGQRSWIHLPGMPVNMQPGEICKIPFIIIVAKTMSIHREHISSIKSISILGFHLAFIVGLILVLCKDTGVALVYVFILIVMAYLGGVKLWWFLGGLAGVCAAGPLLWKYFMREDQKNRILMIFDPTIDQEGLSIRWHTKQSLYSLSNGGLTGQGLYHGIRTQAGALNAQHTDFIFSAIGEELGMIGCIFILVLLCAIVLRCIHVGLKSSNYMNRLICFGIAAMLVFQIGVNVGMCLGVVPVIGLTLPFVSYGGSSIVTMFMAMGIVSGIHMRPSPDSERLYVRPKY